MGGLDARPPPSVLQHDFLLPLTVPPFCLPLLPYLLCHACFNSCGWMWTWEGKTSWGYAGDTGFTNSHWMSSLWKYHYEEASRLHSICLLSEWPRTLCSSVAAMDAHQLTALHWIICPLHREVSAVLQGSSETPFGRGHEFVFEMWMKHNHQIIFCCGSQVGLVYSQSASCIVQKTLWSYSTIVSKFFS